MKKIYIFGNALLPEDSLPIELIPELKKLFPKIEFIHIDPTENMSILEGDITLIDTILGINEIVVFDDLDKLEVGSIYSLHDFDLAMNLKLYRKIDKIGKIKIIGIPETSDKKKILNELIKIIGKL